MAAGRIHNFAFFLLTFYFLKLIDQFESIMQNKPNLLNNQINVSKVLTKDYENKRLCRRLKNKANSNPIQSQFMPKQTQYKANFYTNMQFKPNLVRLRRIQKGIPYRSAV